MAVLSKGNLFDPVLVKDLISKVKGSSSLAKLSGAEPQKFNGSKYFTFSMDKEVDIVAENAAKSHGGITIAPLTIVPIKVEYGARISDEFMLASKEEKIDIWKQFNDGFAKKCARGVDLMAMHGINPRSGSPSAVIGTNHFDAKATQTVDFEDGSNPDSVIEQAIRLVQANDYDVTGLAMSRVYASILADLRTADDNNVRLYKELAWGANPGALNGLPMDVNRTVSDYDAAKDLVILGDFQDLFKWGYAMEIPTEVIEYGDPDNSGQDLKGHNQVYIRAEAYIGWGIMDGNGFARVVDARL